MTNSDIELHWHVISNDKKYTLFCRLWRGEIMGPLFIFECNKYDKEKITALSCTYLLLSDNKMVEELRQIIGDNNMTYILVQAASFAHE